jgi:hypothetical protein
VGTLHTIGEDYGIIRWGHDAPQLVRQPAREGLETMASHSFNEPSTQPASDIIAFVPRHRVHQCVNVLLDLMRSEGGVSAMARRAIAEAAIIHGNALSEELRRAVVRGPLDEALYAITVLLVIADAHAQEMLWALSRTPTLDPALRLEALRGLCQQGHDVPIAQLIALANESERHTHRADRPHPTT